MLFNSWEFLLFFPTVLVLFFSLQHCHRWKMLLAASCIFYMAFIPYYILILLLTIVVDYTAGILIEHSSGRKRDFFLYFSIISTCLILFFFKYFDFVALNVNWLAEVWGLNVTMSPLGLMLPIGLSFHTFQSLSYVIEVYRGNQKPERHFGIYSLYVMFFPQLVAGPIERPQNLLHQFHEKHEFNYDHVTSGLRLMAWGLFKKAVIADNLAKFVTVVYENPSQFDGGVLIVATLFFTFQVFCDFSGYSDMARGAARTMGFNLMLNFDRPYAATSLSDFWRRWHISLSTWLRDYVYDPVAMGLRDWGMYGIVFALMLTFLVSGFWHGANWTFVVWGVLHGTGLSLEAVFAKPRKRLSKVLPAWLFNTTMLIGTFSFVNFTYIFFRAKSLSDAYLIVKNIVNWIVELPIQFSESFHASLLHVGDVVSPSGFKTSCALIIFLVIAHTAQSRIEIEIWINRCAWWVRWPLYQIGVLSIAYGGVWLGARSFIYFQF